MTHSLSNVKILINVGRYAHCDITTTEHDCSDEGDVRPKRIKKTKLKDHIDPAYFGM